MEIVRWVVASALGMKRVSLVQPSHALLWTLAGKALYAFVCVALVWLIRAVVPSVFVSSLLGTILVLVASRVFHYSSDMGAYQWAKKLFPPVHNTEYDQGRRLAFFLILGVLRPLCFFALCVSGAYLWYVPIVLLEECARGELTYRKKNGVAVLFPRNLDYWHRWIATGGVIVVLFIICRLVSSPASGHWLLIGLISAAVSYFLPIGLTIKSGTTQALQNDQEAMRYLFSVILFLLGALACVF